MKQPIDIFRLLHNLKKLHYIEMKQTSFLRMRSLGGSSGWHGVPTKQYKTLFKIMNTHVTLALAQAALVSLGGNQFLGGVHCPHSAFRNESRLMSCYSCKPVELG